MIRCRNLIAPPSPAHLRTDFMDRKTILILIGCVVLWVLLNMAVNNPKWFPPVKVPVPATNAVAPQNVTGTNTATASTTAAGPTPAPPAIQSVARWIVDTNTPEQLIVITNNDARYTFTSYGGGVKTIELLK